MYFFFTSSEKFFVSEILMSRKAVGAKSVLVARDTVRISKLVEKLAGI